MDIINYKDFSNLRLENFVSNKHDIQSLYEVEFMAATWSGQSIGFTEWLRLDSDSKTRSISLDFNELLDATLNKVLSAIKLNVTKGMTHEMVIRTFGQPNNTENFVGDRVTYEYVIGSKEKYYLSLTIHNDKGLIYLVLMNHTDTIKTLEQNSLFLARGSAS